MIVINLIGEPSAGKSRTRAGLFHLMKFKSGLIVEEAPEIVKPDAYLKDQYIFQDQLLILAKQAMILKKLEIGGVQVAITDSPLFFSSIYYPQGSAVFHTFVLEEFRRYQNINYFIKRDQPYKSEGRIQTEDEAKQLNRKITDYLWNNRIGVATFKGDFEAPQKIFEDFCKKTIIV